MTVNGMPGDAAEEIVRYASTTDRVLAIVPPIAAFVAAGFDHSVANMYLVPFARNRLPVTLGNVIGGAVLVGGVHWFVHLRPRLEE